MVPQSQGLDPQTQATLAQLLQQWQQQGGGNAAQGSMATNSQGAMNPVMSPGMASNAAQGVAGSQGVSGSWDQSPTTGLTSSHVDILRKVVNKGIQQQAEQFYQQNPQAAQQVLAAHEPAPEQSGGQGDSSQSQQTQQPQAQQNNMPTGASISPSPQNQQLQQQAANVVNPGGFHPLGALLNALGAVTGVGPAMEGYKGAQLNNIAKAQRINWGTPEGQAQLANAANTNAQTELQNLTNKGQKPIDPEQYLSAYSGMYQKAYDAYSKDEDTGNQITQSSLDAYNKLADTTRNSLQKGLGQSTPQMQGAMQTAAATLKASIDARTNFHDFMMNNSPAQVIGNIKNKLPVASSNVTSAAQNVTSMLQPGESKNFNGNVIKRLK